MKGIDEPRKIAWESRSFLIARGGRTPLRCNQGFERIPRCWREAMAASPRAMSGCVMHSDLFCRSALPTRLNSNRMYTLFTILSTKMKSAPTRRSGRRYLSVADRLNDGDHNHYNAAQNKQRPDHRGDQGIPPTLIPVFHLAVMNRPGFLPVPAVQHNQSQPLDRSLFAENLLFHKIQR